MTITEQHDRKVSMKELKAADPRWCSMCGDYAVLVGVRKFMIKHNLFPEDTVHISGIGCSGRMPHYLNTYGFHTIHGRTVPVATGLILTRPELKVFLHSGDGDSLSIGGNHLLHGIHKNLDCVYILYDNQIYGLTKSQTSPTTQKGVKTETQPYGSSLDPLNPIRFALGSGASFVASTAEWLGQHFVDTLEAAYQHPGFSFVHVAQRCPKYNPAAWDFRSSDWFSFLKDETSGIPVDLKAAEDAKVLDHSPDRLDQAFQVAEDVPNVFGLFYRQQRTTYNQVIKDQTDAAGKKKRSELLDVFAI